MFSIMTITRSCSIISSIWHDGTPNIKRKFCEKAAHQIPPPPPPRGTFNTKVLGGGVPSAVQIL